MKKIANWNSFIINENLKQATAYLKRINVDRNDDNFTLIKDLLRNNTGFLGMFTIFHYEQSVNLNDLTKLLEFLKSNDASKLRNAAVNYTNYNDLIDEIDKIRMQKKIKSVHDELPKVLKTMVLDDSGNYVEKFAILAQDIYDIEVKNGFFKKISKVSDYHELVDTMADFISKFKSGGNYDSMIAKIASVDGAEIVYQDPDEEIIITKIKKFEASAYLGSTNWCIVNQPSSWKSIVTPSINSIKQQYFIWNFKLLISDPLYFCGVTIGNSGNITDAHDFNDYEIKSNIPEHIENLMKYLTPISNEEKEAARVEYERMLSENEKMLIIAEQNRIARLSEENLLKREIDEWDDSNDLVQTLIEYLTDNHGLDLPFLESIDEDIYDVLFDISDSESNSYNIYTFEFEQMKFKIGEEEDVMDYGTDYEEGRIEDFDNPFDAYRDKYFVRQAVNRHTFIESLFHESVPEDIEWSEHIDEDDIRDNWEDYSEIEADEDGDMSESSFDDYIQSLKDDMEDSVLSQMNSDRKEEIEDDPYGYAEMMDGDMYLSASTHVDTYKLAELAINVYGTADSLDTYNGEVEEITTNGYNFIMWRSE